MIPHISAVAALDPCRVCDVIIRFHLHCAACGVLAGWGHEALRREPHGEYKVCNGCWKALRRYRRRIKTPAGNWQQAEEMKVRIA